MAEEQFTSRRARREAERLAAEKEFEARSTPGQQAETNRADLLAPPQPPTEKPRPASTPEPQDAAASRTGASASAAARTEPAEAPAGRKENPAVGSRIDPNPAPTFAHERGALATDHLPQERPPVNAQDRLDPRRAPLPHFETRAARKQYLREHGLSTEGDLSTGALPVIADPDEDAADETASVPASGAEASAPTEHESFDAAGFGGSSDEVAARDFESPVTADAAPRPAGEDALSRSRPGSGEDALTRPEPELETDPARDGESQTASRAGSQPAASAEAEADSEPATDTESSRSRRGSDDAQPPTRSRRMPIVQPPTTSGVRVVTAASAQAGETRVSETRVSETPVSDSAEASTSTDRSADEASARAEDEAARALAANPETIPMDAVAETWALPNSDYEDEETENPPGDRIRASAVTGHDGQILVGEEPSKVPFVVLGVAAVFAVALIVIALIMLL